MGRARTTKKGLGTPGRFSLTRDSARDTLARGIPFERIARAVLGRRYELSIAFVSPREMRKLNRNYRKRDRSTDVLSFSLAPDMGELIFSSADIMRRASVFGMTPRAYLAYLVVHGALHLAGHDHGRTMDREEKKRCKQLGLTYPRANA